MELINRPRYDTILKEFDDQANLIPGFYWEVTPNNVGFGMTCLVKSSRQESVLPEINYEWYLGRIGSWDFRYHFLRHFPLDPFAEAGFGCAGRVDITNYGVYDLGEERDPLNLSLFGQLGGGLAFRIQHLHVGAKVLYRFYNQPPPANYQVLASGFTQSGVPLIVAQALNKTSGFFSFELDDPSVDPTGVSGPVKVTVTFVDDMNHESRHSFRLYEDSAYPTVVMSSNLVWTYTYTAEMCRQAMNGRWR